MGTPRVSSSLDQMSRIQMSASIGGECAVQSRLEKINEATAAGLSPATTSTEAKFATFC